MASLKDLRSRIASVKATQKITKAMQMVAAAKLRRAQMAAEAARPYAERMSAVLANVAGGVAGEAGDGRVEGAGKAALSGADDEEMHVVLAGAAQEEGGVGPVLQAAGEVGENRAHPLGVGPRGGGRGLRAAQLRRRDHLHRLGDLARRLDRGDAVAKGL